MTSYPTRHADGLDTLTATLRFLYSASQRMKRSGLVRIDDDLTPEQLEVAAVTIANGLGICLEGVA